MKYLALIYSNHQEDDARGEAWNQAHMGDYMKFEEWLRAEGVTFSGEALQPVATATTVRVRGGKTITTDGPFAETKEQLGGYYLFEAENLDRALALAARIPTAEHGAIEVRPIFDTSNM